MTRQDKPEESGERGIDDMVRSAFKDPAPPEVRARLQPHFEALRARVIAAGVLPRWHARAWRPRRIAAAFIIAVAAFAAGSLAVNLDPRPTWADVVEKFGAVHGFQADVYVKERGGGDPIHVELWMGQGGLARMRTGSEVSFARRGRIVDTILLDAHPLAPRAARARDMVRDFVESVGEADAFSLETLIEVLPGSTAELEVLETQASAPSHDLIVFDMAGEDQDLHVRIWALRRSRLPVRVLFRDVTSGEQVDVALSYTSAQPSEFFEPARFRREAEEHPGETGGL